MENTTYKNIGIFICLHSMMWFKKVAEMDNVKQTYQFRDTGINDKFIAVDV